MAAATSAKWRSLYTERESKDTATSITHSKSINILAITRDREHPVANRENGFTRYNKRRPRGGERPQILCPRSLRAFCNQLGVATKFKTCN